MWDLTKKRAGKGEEKKTLMTCSPCTGQWSWTCVSVPGMDELFDRWTEHNKNVENIVIDDSK